MLVPLIAITIAVSFSSVSAASAEADENRLSELSSVEDFSYAEELNSIESSNEPTDDLAAIISAASNYDSEEPSTVLDLAQTVAGRGASYQGSDDDSVSAPDGTMLSVSPESGEISLSTDDAMGAGEGISFSTASEPASTEILDGAIVQQDINGDNSSSITQPTDDGFQVIYILDDAESADNVEFDIELPADTTLQLQEDGSISVIEEIDIEVPDTQDQKRYESEVEDVLGLSLEEGLELSESEFKQIRTVDEVTTDITTVPIEVGLIETPWAVDATGQALETHFEITNEGIRQVIETDENTSFPVIADPSWFDKAKSWLGKSWTWTRGKVWSGVTRTSKWVKVGSKWVWKSGKFVIKKAGYLGLALCAAGAGWAWYRSDASGWVRVGDAITGCIL